MRWHCRQPYWILHFLITSDWPLFWTTAHSWDWYIFIFISRIRYARPEWRRVMPNNAEWRRVTPSDEQRAVPRPTSLHAGTYVLCMDVCAHDYSHMHTYIYEACITQLFVRTKLKRSEVRGNADDHRDHAKFLRCKCEITLCLFLVPSVPCHVVASTHRQDFCCVTTRRGIPRSLTEKGV